MSAKKHQTRKSQEHPRSSNISQFVKDMNYEINQVVIDVLNDPNGNIQSCHIKNLVKLMHSSYKLFKKSYFALIDKILTLEQKDSKIKVIYKLLERFYGELYKVSTFAQGESNSFFVSLVRYLCETYFFPKLDFHIQVRSAFLLVQVFSNPGWALLQLESDAKEIIYEVVIDMITNSRHSLQMYGIQICSQICKFDKQNDNLAIQYFKIMTHSNGKEVRKTAITSLKAPFTPYMLMFLAKRLRDKDPDVRKITFTKLTKNQVTIDQFPSSEARMLIMKEGLTDPNEQVRQACFDFLNQTLKKHENDFCVFFRLIDCKKMNIKEYYVQLPFLLINFVFQAIEDDLKITQYLSQIINKLKQMSSSDTSFNQDEDPNREETKITFEELLFMRIVLEYLKVCKKNLSSEFFDELHEVIPDFYVYNQIFDILNKDQDRLLISEWVKFSLQLHIEDEVTRRNIVSKMFSYISDISTTYEDYQRQLKPKRMIFNEQNKDKLNNTVTVDYDSDQEYENIQDEEEIKDSADEQVIEIEIRGFQDLGNAKDIQEYCKPFSYESLVLDSDDVCKIAVIVCRKLLDERADDFSLSMLHAISDIKENLEDNAEQGYLSFKTIKDQIYKRLEEKLDSVNELVATDNYSFEELNRIMKKVRKYVVIIEELNLKEKLCFKRALTLCVILLKQCRADANDQNLISICETVISPTIQSKDKDNMLLAVECIGLLCLLDKELFWNYSKIFQTILTEDVTHTNLPEKIIALKSSVDSLIIHGSDQKTQKLQKIIIEDYLIIKDKVLRQVCIEGVCKMLFSRKLTVNADQNEMEYIISFLIIQWFDKSFNWQNSLVRQVLSVFFKSFILFSEQRCQVMMNSVVKVVFSILESKYGGSLKMKKNQKMRNKKNLQAALSKNQPSNRYSSGSEDSILNESDINDYQSDDSQCYLTQAKMEQICKQLDAVQISKVFMLLLSKEYINANAAKEFKLKEDFNVQYLLKMAYINNNFFKKVAIVKDFIAPLVDYADISNCQDIRTLEDLKDQIERNNKMLVQGNQKLKSLIAAIDKKIKYMKMEMIDEIDELDENEQQEEVKEAYEMNIEQYETFYEDEILGVMVDLVVDDDDEYKQINQVQNLGAGMASPFNFKNKKRLSEISVESDNDQSQLRRGSRNRTISNSGQELKTIKEDEKERETSKKRAALCETILEEKSNINENMSHDEEYIEDRSRSRDQRKGIMSKISKQMAKDFTQNKKKSVLSASNCTQINEIGIKEEFDDGRTIFKISKNKSISPINKDSDREIGFNQQNRIPGFLNFNNRKSDQSDQQENVANNLSVQFEKIPSDEKPRKSEASDASEKVYTRKRKQVQKSNHDSSFESSNGKLNPAKDLMTRSRMKSISNNSSQNKELSEDDDASEESSNGIFGFMKGIMTKVKKGEDKGKKEQLKTGKRLLQDLSEDEDADSGKENIGSIRKMAKLAQTKSHRRRGMNEMNSAQNFQDEPFMNQNTLHKPSSMDDFDLQHKLGDGAYSSVYQITRKCDGMIYALKKVKLNNLSDKEKENAINEVRILASIKHPHVISYKEAFFELSTSSLCIVMEFCDNGDLFQKILDHQKNKTMFEEKDIWKVLIQVVRGLKALHELNIMHRDLKSANVFLCKDFIAKLGDMNVSKVANKKGLNYTQTGTPYYASPEVWRDEPYDGKSDIWSLGCVLYEMIALRPPFTADDMAGLFKKVTKGYVSRIPKIYSHDLWQVVKQLLQVNPAYRPSCDQIMNMPTFAKKASKFFSDKNSKLEQSILLKTIKFPKNLMYLSDKLPHQNYSQDSFSFEMIKDDLNKSQVTTHKKSTKQIKELLLPSIQNVKQIYMNPLNHHSSDLEQSPQILAISARKKNARSLPKTKKEHSILKNESQSDGANLDHMKQEDTKQLVEHIRIMGGQRNSLQLDILTEEMQSKISDRNDSLEIKKLKTDASVKNLVNNERRNELPAIRNQEKNSLDIKGQQYNKSKSPTLLKSKAQAALNSQGKHLANSLDYSTSQLIKNESQVEDQEHAIRVIQNSKIQTNGGNNKKVVIHQYQKSEDRSRASPIKIQEILNRYNLKSLKQKSNSQNRNTNSYTYNKQSINTSISPSQRNLHKSISRQQIEISINDEQQQQQQQPIHLKNLSSHSYANNVKSTIKLPRLDNPQNRKHKFVIEAIEIYKSNNTSPKREQRIFNKSKNNNASFDSRIIKLQKYVAKE